MRPMLFLLRGGSTDLPAMLACPLGTPLGVQKSVGFAPIPILKDICCFETEGTRYPSKP